MIFICRPLFFLFAFQTEFTIIAVMLSDVLGLGFFFKFSLINII